MNKKYLIVACVLLSTGTILAQNTFVNESVTTTDLIGTARYIGMGGALGALGADISVISSNPAGIGLYRRSDLAGTLSVMTQVDKKARGEDFTHVSFDNMGFVISAPMSSSGLEFINFGFNYQKKANFNHAMKADNYNTGGLSQTYPLARLSSMNLATPLCETAWNAFLYGKDENEGYYGYAADNNQYARISEGSLQGFDFNLSMNFQSRYYLGLTVGVDNLNYKSNSLYSEFYNSTVDNKNYEAYSLYNYQRISGYGVNVKIGGIVRPFGDSPFRIGLTIETPTYYYLDSHSSYSIDSPFDEDGNYSNQFYNYPGLDLYSFEYNLATPWKLRFSLGHTVGSFLALGAEYEYADYSATTMGYGGYDYDMGYDEFYRDKDKSMEMLTENSLKKVHTFRVGAEVKLSDKVSFRAGYNYSSGVYDMKARLDQTLDSPAFNYSTSTEFMNKSGVNIFTAGLGYRGRNFYADIAYKYKNQSADFYAFDDTGLGDIKLNPVEVDLSRHQVFFTLGYRF